MAILSRFWRGWMVEALFGKTTGHRRRLFQALIAAAIVWPVLLFGILVPKLAVQILAFVPLPDSVPAWTVRLVWIALAVFIPLAVGAAVAVQAPTSARHGPLVWRVLRGYPITVGVTVSFGIIFLSVPVIQLATLIRKQASIAIPLIMDASAYRQVARRACHVLNRQGFSFRPADPGWWVTLPMAVLTRLGGDALRSNVPDRLEHFETDDLTMSLYPSGLLLRGQRERLTWAHGLIAEAVVHTDGLQTTDPKALAFERRLRPLWRRYDADPGTCPGDADLIRDLERLTRDLKIVQIDWDDWQVLYRQLLQLARAVHGEPPLLESGPPVPLEAGAGLRPEQARPEHSRSG
jgi:hypothetical protein